MAEYRKIVPTIPRNIDDPDIRKFMEDVRLAILELQKVVDFSTRPGDLTVDGDIYCKTLHEE